MTKIISTSKFLAAILICQAAGFVGSLFTTPSIGTWYATLERPSIAPPNWIFAPVWTTLFVLMGIALFIIWNSRVGSAAWNGKSITRIDRKTALQVFGAQLLMNILWSILFFALHSPRSALIEIFSLWLAIIATMIAFYKISKVATYLLIPYLLWVTFAAYLNYSYWVIN